MLNALEQTKLEKFKISEERFRRESKALLDLGYDVDAIKKLIIRSSSKNTVTQVIARTKVLKGQPYYLSLQQIAKIASCNGGVRNLKALENGYRRLRNIGFDAEQIIKMVSHDGGSKNLEAVQNYYQALQSFGFNAEQIMTMVSHHGGSKNIEVVQSSYQALHRLCFDAEKIIKMVSHGGGSKNIEAVQNSYQVLLDFGFNVLQIVEMVSHDGGSKNIDAVVRLYDALRKQGYSLEQITHQVSKSGGFSALTALMGASKGDSWEIKWLDELGFNLNEDAPDLRAASPFGLFFGSGDDASLENLGLPRLNF